MEISIDVSMILNRCRIMNCIHAGQSFSAKTMFDACGGGPGRSELAIKDMIDQTLILRTPTGAYRLTSEGAAALKASAVARQQQGTPKKHFGRPPINKM